jgi:hypothetical protein
MIVMISAMTRLVSEQRGMNSSVYLNVLKPPLSILINTAIINLYNSTA